MNSGNDTSNKTGNKKDGTLVAALSLSLHRPGALPSPCADAESAEKVRRVARAALDAQSARVDRTVDHTIDDLARIEQLFKNYSLKSGSVSGREAIERALQINPLAAFRTAPFHRSLDLLEKAAFCYGSARRARLSTISSLLNELWLRHKVDFISGESLQRIEEAFSEGRLISGSLHIERKGLLDLALRGIGPIADEYENSLEAGPRAGRVLRTSSSQERRDLPAHSRHAFSELPEKDAAERPAACAPESENAAPRPLPRGKVIVFPRRGRRRDDSRAHR